MSRLHLFLTITTMSPLCHACLHYNLNFLQLRESDLLSRLKCCLIMLLHSFGMDPWSLKPIFLIFFS